MCTKKFQVTAALLKQTVKLEESNFADMVLLDDKNSDSDDDDNDLINSEKLNQNGYYAFCEHDCRSLFFLCGAGQGQ